MSKRNILWPAILLAGLLSGGVAAAQEAESASAEAPKPPRVSWSFSGPFGVYDTAQLQRGYSIYKQVCSGCHSQRHIAFRDLALHGGPQFSEGQVKALAESYKVQDGPDDSGNMFERPGRPSDYFPSPFPNEQAARAANGGALPPDMSELAKARSYEEGGVWFLLAPFSQYQEHGVDYIHALLNGYRDPPKGFNLPEGKYYNVYFPGHAISMPPPLADGAVTYTDGSPQTLDQYSKDIAAYLMWAAEPKLDQRKQIGFAAVIYLAVFAFMLWQVKKRVWAGVKDTSGTQAASTAPLTAAKPRV